MRLQLTRHIEHDVARRKDDPTPFVRTKKPQEVRKAMRHWRDFVDGTLPQTHESRGATGSIALEA